MSTGKLCLPSTEKSEKIEKLKKELSQEQARLAKANCVLKHYTECKGFSQDLKLKVENIIKTKEVQSAVKLKGEDGKFLSLFGLSDSEISAFYGDITLDSAEKQWLKEDINLELLEKFGNSSVYANKTAMSLDQKIKLVEIADTLQSKIKIGQKLLRSNEDDLNQLVVLQSRSKKNEDNHTSKIVLAAQVLSSNTKVLELGLEDAIVGEDANIVKAMNMLIAELNCLVLQDSLKLKQLNTTAEEYTKVDGTEFQSLLRAYISLLKSLEKQNFMLETLNEIG